MPLSLILSLIAIAAPVVVYAAMDVRTSIAVNNAVVAERTAQEAVCTGRLKAVAAIHNEAVAKAAASARAAADAIDRTPETAAELAALCARSSSCRTRSTGVSP